MTLEQDAGFKWIETQLKTVEERGGLVSSQNLGFRGNTRRNPKASRSNSLWSVCAPFDLSCMVAASKLLAPSIFDLSSLDLHG